MTEAVTEKVNGKRLSSRASLIAFCLLTLAFFLSWSPGCSSGPAWLTFKSTQSDREYSQKFSRAYFARDRGGEYNAVLIEDGLAPPTPASSGGPIPTAATTPLSQVVHLRVLWQPLRGVKPDTPSATNAVIDWYVRSNDPANRGDQLHYRGAGFVRIDDSNDQARFVIRNARLELTDGTGRLTDPLGESVLTGSFVATRNEGMVTTTLATVREQSPPPGTAQSQPPADPTSHEGPPPRAPAGP